MNVKQARNLLKLADFLENQVPAKRFDMGDWASGPDLSTAPECGTSACALGWATVAFPRVLKLVPRSGYSAYVTRRSDGADDDTIIADMFGIGQELLRGAAGEIFYGRNCTPKTKAKQIRKLVKDNSLEIIRG